MRAKERDTVAKYHKTVKKWLKPDNLDSPLISRFPKKKILHFATLGGIRGGRREMKCLTGQRSNAHPLIKEKAKNTTFRENISQGILIVMTGRSQKMPPTMFWRLMKYLSFSCRNRSISSSSLVIFCRPSL